MAFVRNPRKVFQYSIEIDGFEQWAVQKVTIGDTEIDKVMHGDANFDVKTGGRIKFGDIILERLRPLPQYDVAAWLWLMAVQDPDAGGGLLPDIYKRVLTINELDTTGKIPINRYLAVGAWPTKIGQNAFDRNSSDNIIETITLSVDRIRRL